ncbi:MAG: hypothetical protein H6510_16360 [Acidobacteria bacterium]|nr:hypothetical protein [Acidobacteriota bacterium]MCB9399387.1 hypothetical protein [Acidobacteriota bacterium]
MIVILFWFGFQPQADFWVSHSFLSGKVVKSENQFVWQGEWTQDQPFPLLILENPDIEGTQYAVRGQVRGESVQMAYLEMWSVFPDGSRYFTRTLGETGSMAKLTGTFEWRNFELPFDTLGKVPAPVRLEINLIGLGHGQVQMGPLEIVSVSRKKSGWLMIWFGLFGLAVLALALTFSIDGLRRWVGTPQLGLVGLGLWGLLAVLMRPPGQVLTLVLASLSVLSILLVLMTWRSAQNLKAEDELRKIQAFDRR